MNTKPQRSNIEVSDYSSGVAEDALLVAQPKKRRPFENRAILGLAAISLVVLPFFYGGRSATAVFAFQVAVLALGTVLALREILRARSEKAASKASRPSLLRRESLFAGLLMSFVCLAFLQTVELPLSLLEIVSPRAANAYARSGELSGFLSLDIHQTTEAAWMVLSLSLLLVALVALPLESVSVRAKGGKRWGEKRSSSRRSSSSRRFFASRRDRISTIMQSLVVLCGVLLSAVAIGHWTVQAERLFGIFAPSRTLFSGTTPHWPFVNPDHLSIFLEVAIAVGTAFFFRALYMTREDARRNPSQAKSSLIAFLLQPEKFGRLVYLSVGVLLMLLCCLLTLSRAGNSLALFGIAALSLLYMSVLPKTSVQRNPASTRPGADKSRVFFNRRTMQRVTLWFVSFFAFACLVSFLVGESGRHSLYQRVDYGLTVKYEQLRSELSRASWEVFLANPVSGVGLGNWSLAAGEFGSEEFAGFKLDFAHNEMLQLAAEMGAIGLGITLLAIGLVSLWTIRAWRKDLEPTTRIDLLGSTLAIFLPFVHSFVDFPLHLPALAVLLTVCLAVHLRLLHWIDRSVAEKHAREQKPSEALLA